MNLLKPTSLMPLKCFVFLICFWAFGLEDVKGQYCFNLDLYWLNSQAELDSWGITNEACTYFGWVSVGSNSSIVSDVTDLSPLSNITRFNIALSISRNPVLTTLSDLENLESSGSISINDNDVLPNLSGLENLTTISSQFTTFNSVGVLRNPILNDISGISNANLSTVERLRIIDNPQLNFCSHPNICDYIFSGGVAHIGNNGSGCSSEYEVLSSCSQFANVQIQSFFDINQNKIQDNGEPNLSELIGITNINFPSQERNYYTDNKQDFVFVPGFYNAFFNQAAYPAWSLTTDSTSYNLFLYSGDIENIAFGFYPDQAVSNLVSTITSPSARCNETITFDLNTKNLGTTTASGTLWLEADENILATDFIDTPDTTVTPNRYGWFFDDLYPSYSIEKQIALQIPGPPDFPLGDSLTFQAYVNFEDENGTNTSSTFTYAPEVRCSYDPNDKLVNPAREGDYALFDEDLIYTVRFQNTGNDVAYDVVILDTLDANLDRETFRLLGSSHAERLNTSMNDAGVLKFEFKNIFLPDSTSNFEGSQGYVSYLIRAADGLAEETPITNSAGIYFDLNPPIITNTTQSIMVSQLPTVSVQSPDNQLVFNIIPNPNSGSFYVQEITNGVYRIFNTMGQVIHSGQMNQDAVFDISQAAAGVYLIEIQDKGQVATQRFVKQ